MITASHNPPEYNGVKFKASYGGPFLTEDTLQVENYLGKSEIKKYSGKIEETDLFEPYLLHINELVDFNKTKKSNLNTLIDSMSGAGATVIEDILEGHGCQAKTIFGIPDENFSGRYAEPIEVNLKPLSETLQSNNNFALGVATDGDADRLGVILENGKWLSAQETILLLADYVKNEKAYAGDLVKTSSVTDKLRINFANDKCKVYDVQVGFKYICEKMIISDIAFGAEESGGFGYSRHIPERDGILSALFMIEMLASSGYKKLSKYVESKRKQFGEIFYDRIDYKYEKEDRIEKLPSLYENPPDSISSYKIVKIEKYFSSRNIINGLKFFLEGNTRWLLLRASETEPLIRIYAEGQSNSEVKNLLHFGVELFNV